MLQALGAIDEALMLLGAAAAVCGVALGVARLAGVDRLFGPPVEPAVDPGITVGQVIDRLTFLAGEAHQRGVSAALAFVDRRGEALLAEGLSLVGQGASPMQVRWKLEARLSAAERAEGRGAGRTLFWGVAAVTALMLLSGLLALAVLRSTAPVEAAGGLVAAGVILGLMSMPLLAVATWRLERSGRWSRERMLRDALMLEVGVLIAERASADRVSAVLWGLTPRTTRRESRVAA